MICCSIMLAAVAAAGSAAAPLPPPLPTGDEATLRSAFQLEDAGRWSDAAALIGGIRDPLARKLVLWRSYVEAPQPDGFAGIAAFIDQNPRWPARNALLAKAEKTLYQERGGRDVAGWLRRHPPVSGLGRILQAEVLMAQGRMQEGIALIRKSWAEDGYPSDIEPDVEARFSVYLRPSDYAARADRLLWDRNLTGAARTIPYLDPTQRALVQARMELIRSAPRAAQTVGALPSNVRRDPGLLYDEVKWRLSRNMDESAVSLLLSIDAKTVAGAHADAWWNLRSRLVRAALKDRDYRNAYRLVDSHGQKDGADYAEAEWLAGWIALRFLNDPASAYSHFSNMYNGVSKPISLGRGAYWAGRAAQAGGRAEVARGWFDKGSHYFTTFYGQLAAQAAGLSTPRPLPGTPPVSAAQWRTFTADELVRATRILTDMNQTSSARRFGLQLIANADSASDWVMLGRFFGQIGRTDLQVLAGKQAGYRHVVLPEIAYPTTAAPPTLGPDRALIDGLTRQESAFYSQAISPAGARGLMQLMPGTAKMVADHNGMPYSLSRLTSDPRYNMTLGATYLQAMLDRFGGANVLAIAAYNAGPGRVDQWLGTFGDPRTGQIDMLDWIELIPIAETRNYVQRVLENTQIYRQILGDPGAPIRIRDDIYRGATASEPMGFRPRVPS
jgi:soluble lytic murein transglycosylase